MNIVDKRNRDIVVGTLIRLNNGRSYIVVHHDYNEEDPMYNAFRLDSYAVAYSTAFESIKELVDELTEYGDVTIVDIIQPPSYGIEVR